MRQSKEMSAKSLTQPRRPKQKKSIFLPAESMFSAQSRQKKESENIGREKSINVEVVYSFSIIFKLTVK
jgi:hypothetical protein